MIKTWKNSASQKLFETGKCKFSGIDQNRALALLAFVHAATELGALRALQGVRFHKLKGARKGEWSITINGPWRITFKFKNGDAYDVEVGDYH